MGELVGVTIRLKSGIGRADMERMFIKAFIGTSDNAYSCNIINIDDIDLYYNRNTETLIATCAKPIQIENKRLAYHINYYLDKFKATRQNVIYQGNSQFTDLAAVSNKKKVERDREDAYDGSRMEFIRALRTGTLAKHGFEMYSPWLKLMLPDSIVTINNHLEQFVNLKYKATIVHNGEGRLASRLGQNIENCYIDTNGFYDTGLQWFGPMGSQRMGDMLPFEYQSIKDTGSTLSAFGNRSKIIAADSTPYRVPGYPKELKLFKTVVLAPNNALDQQLIVRKWHMPIRYKAYGFGAAIGKNIDSMFNQLARLTGLQITKTSDDTSANFLIMAGESKNYNTILSTEALAYFKGNGGEGGAYYNAGINGFSTMVQQVRPVAGLPLWAVIQKQIMKGFGFFGSLDGYSGSVFMMGLKQHLYCFNRWTAGL